MLYQGRDVSTVATYVKKKSTEIRRRTKQNQQQSVVGKCGNDRVPFLVLEYRGVDRTLERRAAQALSFRNQCGHPRGEIFVVEAGRGESFDQQPVFAQNENGINSRSLAERGGKVSNVGHLSGEKLRS
jgi:hypothetical protein